MGDGGPYSAMSLPAGPQVGSGCVPQLKATAPVGHSLLQLFPDSGECSFPNPSGLEC